MAKSSNEMEWGTQRLEIITNSVTVASWLNSALLEIYCIKAHGISEMLVKRRLAIVKEIYAD